MEAPKYEDVIAKCAAQSNNYGTVVRAQNIEKRKKKRHDD
jgi:hypothetical protein